MSIVFVLTWAETLLEWNHVPQFPYFVTHYGNSMPIASIRGILCDVLFNPEYASCVYKVTIAIDSLGNIVWICLLSPLAFAAIFDSWEHVPAHVWVAPAHEDNDDEDVVGDDGDVYALCCTKSDHEKMSMCDKCQLLYCTDCIDTYACDCATVFHFA